MVQPADSANSVDRRGLNGNNNTQREVDAKVVEDQARAGQEVDPPQRSTRNVNTTMPPVHPRVTKINRGGVGILKKTTRMAVPTADPEVLATL